MNHHPQKNKGVQTQPLFFRVPHLFFLFSVMLLVESCGYSLEFKRIDENAEDPITVVRRELRQLKADHRVAIFDLQKEQKSQLEAMHSDLARVSQGNETLGQSLIQMKRDFSEANIRLGQNNADTDERFAEMEIQHRLIHGRIEEESNRIKESIARSNDFTVKALEGFRKDIEAQGKNLALQNKGLGAQKETLLRFEEKQTQVRQTLQEQISGLDSRDLALEKISKTQTKNLQSVSTQLAELIDKMLPAVNGLAARVDNLEWELKQLKTNSDLEDLQKRLTKLREAIDVQRQSLEMLGNTLAAQVDKQGALLQKTVKELKGLQSKPSSTSESP